MKHIDPERNDQVVRHEGLRVHRRVRSPASSGCKIKDHTEAAT